MKNFKKESLRSPLIALFLLCLTVTALYVAKSSYAGSDDAEKSVGKRSLTPLNDPNMPKHIDVRLEALNRSGEINLKEKQKKATVSLQNRLGGEGNLQVTYNGLTGTPSRIINSTLR